MWRWIALAGARIRCRPGRSLATIAGVAAAAALAAAALHLQWAGQEALTASSGEPLVVMQRDRFCPSTSFLPMEDEAAIAALPHVVAVEAQQVLVSDCRVSLTSLTVRGVDGESFAARSLPQLTVMAGGVEAWLTQPNQALVGSQVARARQLKVGDTLEHAGLRVTVAAIVDGPRMQHRASVWVTRPTLEAASTNQAGQATLFEVDLTPGADGEAVAVAIDQALDRRSQTAPLSAMVARIAEGLATVLRAAGLVALAAALAALLLIANTAILGARSAARDFGVLRAIGHPLRAVATVVIAEGGLAGLIGATIGAVVAVIGLSSSALAISTEGVSVVISARPGVIILVALGGAVLGAAAAAIPAWWSARSGLLSVLRGGG